MQKTFRVVLKGEIAKCLLPSRVADIGLLTVEIPNEIPNMNSKELEMFDVLNIVAYVERTYGFFVLDVLETDLEIPEKSCNFVE